MKTALIVHGTEGYPEENWFPWAKQQLEKHGYKVLVPQFPTPENQTPEHWFKALGEDINAFNDESILIGHSLGGTFILRVLEKLNIPIKASVFVATPIGIPPIKYIETDRPFTLHPFDWEKIRNSSKNFLVFHSESDPYVGLINGQTIAKNLDTTLIKVPEAGHFNAKAGYTTFELLMEKLGPLL